MNQAVTIRLARPEDATRIRAMHRASLRSLGRVFYSAGLIEKFLAEFETLDETLIADGTCLCIEIGSVIAASGAWTLRPQALSAHSPDAAPSASWRPHATIRSVFTDPRFARRGLASAIMRQCEEEAAARGGAAQLNLYATLSGVTLYQRLGYSTLAPVGIPLSGGERFDAVQMTKPVATSEGTGIDHMRLRHRNEGRCVSDALVG